MNHRSRSHLGSGSALPSVFDTMSEPDYEGDHRSEVSADSPCDGMEEESGGTSTEQAKELQRLCDGLEEEVGGTMEPSNGSVIGTSA